MRGASPPSRAGRRAPGAFVARRAALQARQRRHDAILRALARLRAGEVAVPLRLLGLDLELGLDPRRVVAAGETFWALVRTRRYGIRLALVIEKDRGATRIYRTRGDARELGAGPPDVAAYVQSARQGAHALDGFTLESALLDPRSR